MSGYLLRRVHKNQYQRRGDEIRVLSSAFTDPNMSCDDLSILQSLGFDESKTLEKFDPGSYILVQISKTELISLNLGLKIIPSPSKSNASHTEVQFPVKKGAELHRIARSIAKISKVIIPQGIQQIYD